MVMYILRCINRIIYRIFGSTHIIDKYTNGDKPLFITLENFIKNIELTLDGINNVLYSQNTNWLQEKNKKGDENTAFDMCKLIPTSLCCLNNIETNIDLHALYTYNGDIQVILANKAHPCNFKVQINRKYERMPYVQV